MLKPEEREYINKYLFIDGQYFLTRNWAFLKTRDWLSLSKLIEVTMLSIKKIQDKVLANNVILLWDSWPYRKTQELVAAGVDYKGDREFALDKINEIKALMATETDEQKLAELSEELKREEKEYASFLIRKDAKKIIKEKFPEFGIGCLSITGLEADDLACMASLWSPKHIDIDKRERNVICSSDSDWVSFCAPSLDFYRTTKVEEWLKYEDADRKIPKKYQPFGVDLYSYNLLHDAYYGNHNNLKKNEDVIKNYSFSTVLTKFNNGSLDEIPYINNVYKALDIVNYYNSDIEAEFDNVCLNLKPNFGAFLDFLGEQKITQIGSRFFDEFFYYNEFSKQDVENSN